MESGTDVIKVLEDGMKSISDSILKLAETPPIELNQTPFHCPACGMVGPVVTILNNDVKSGNSLEMIFQFECHNCNRTIYGVPVSWSMFNSAEEAIREINNVSVV